MTERTIVHGARQLVRIDGDGLEVVEDGAVVVEDGTVAAVGPTAEVTRSHPTDAADTVVDASGKTVLPGYVDPHTHAVFAGDRVDEFAAKLRGKSYQDPGRGRRDPLDGAGRPRGVRSVPADLSLSKYRDFEPSGPGG